MKILLTGAAGQLGTELKHYLRDFELQSHDIDTLDLTDQSAVSSKLGYFKPDLVINAAAYTAVDQA